MSRIQLEKMCLNEGMNRSTFFAYLDYSPIMEKFGPGVYGLRGAKIAPGVVESLTPAREPKTTVRLDHGWTPDRKVWIAYKVSDGMLANGAFSIPTGLKDILAGTYSLQSSDGQKVGSLVVKGSAGWGLGPFFRRRGGEAGDTIVTVMDVSTRCARVELGDNGLLEQFQPDLDSDADVASA